MISMKNIVSQDKYCDEIEIHELRDLLMPKIKKSKDPINHYWNNSARRLFVDVLAAYPKNSYSFFDEAKALIEKSSIEELVAFVSKPKSQFSKMVSKGDIKGAECVRSFLLWQIRYPDTDVVVGWHRQSVKPSMKA